MNNHQRGVYQPLPENVPIYDLSDEEADEGGRSRAPLLIVIVLIVLAAFAGVVWLAYNQGVARGRAGTSVVIAAPDGPVRTAPGDTAGATPYTGLKVYGDPVPPDQEAQGSSLAKSTPSAPEIVASIEAQRQSQPPAAQATTESPPVRFSPAPPATPASAAAAAPPAPAPQRVATQAPPKPAAPAATPAAGGSAVSGKAVLQIGAYESVALATDAWNTFKARHAEITGSLSDDVQKVDLGAKGIWYRLRVGPFADKVAAVSACEKLKTQGATCFVATP